jgi:hypothetical protein
MEIDRMDTRKLLKSVAVSEASFEGNTLVCWPSVTGVMDLYGDVIFPGAFKNALTAFLQRGFVPTDHRWEWTSLVAMPTIAEERGNKLYSECVFHSDQASQDALTKCKERLNRRLQVGQSIGFTIGAGQYVNFPNGKALLEYARKNKYDMSLFDAAGISGFGEPCSGMIEIEELWEYSLTPSPANQSAMAIAVKSATGVSLGLGREGGYPPRGIKMNIKPICGAVALPLVETDATWNAKGAESRLRELTGAKDAPTAEYAKGFILVDGDNDRFESYKLPFVDVKGGKMVAVPKALMAAANVLGGNAGAGFAVAEAVIESAKTFVEGYYAKMTDGKLPWDASGAPMYKGQYLGQYVEYSMCMGAMNQAHYSLMDEVGDAMTGYGDYADMSGDELSDAISNMFDEHKQLCMSVIKSIMSGNAEETTDQAKAYVKRFAVEMIGLGDGPSYSKHARLVVDAARAFIERTKSRIDLRIKEGRMLSEANCKTLQECSDTLGQCAADIDILLDMAKPKADVDELKALKLEFYKQQVAA